MRILIICTLLFGMRFTTLAQSVPAPVKAVFDKYSCGSCHVLDKRMVGPSWRELSAKKYSPKKMAKLIREPKPENWPNFPPMAPITHISDAEVRVVADWLGRLQKI